MASSGWIMLGAVAGSAYVNDFMLVEWDNINRYTNSIVLTNVRVQSKTDWNSDNHSYPTYGSDTINCTVQSNSTGAYGIRVEPGSYSDWHNIGNVEVGGLTPAQTSASVSVSLYSEVNQWTDYGSFGVSFPPAEPQGTHSISATQPADVTGPYTIAVNGTWSTSAYGWSTIVGSRMWNNEDGGIVGSWWRSSNGTINRNMPYNGTINPVGSKRHTLDVGAARPGSNGSFNGPWPSDVTGDWMWEHELGISFLPPSWWTYGATASVVQDKITWNRNAVENTGYYGVQSNGEYPTKTQRSVTTEMIYRKKGASSWSKAADSQYKISATSTSAQVSHFEPCTTYQLGVLATSGACNNAYHVHSSKTDYFWGDDYWRTWTTNAVAKPTVTPVEIKIECATPPIFSQGATFMNPTGQTTAHYEFLLNSPGQYGNYYQTTIQIRNYFSDTWQTIKTWGAVNQGQGDITGLIPGEIYYWRAVACNDWGYHLCSTQGGQFRTDYPEVVITKGPYTNGVPGDTRYDFTNVATYATTRWSTILQIPSGTNNATQTGRTGTIVGTNGGGDSKTWRLFDKTSAETLAVGYYLSGTMTAPDGETLTENGQNFTSAVTSTGNNTGDGENYNVINNHRMWIWRQDATEPALTSTPTYLYTGTDLSHTFNIGNKNYTPNMYYKGKVAVVNGMGMYSLINFTLYPPAYNGTHTLTPTPSGTADEPTMRLVSTVSNTGGMNGTDADEILYHVLDGRPASSSTWTRLASGGAGQKSYTFNVPLAGIICNEDYIIRVTTYNTQKLSSQKTYTFTPPTGPNISVSHRNELGVAYVTTSVSGHGSAQIVKRETFWKLSGENVWNNSEINYSNSDGNIVTRTPRVLEHEGYYDIYVKLTNGYGLCRTTNYAHITMLEHYHLYDKTWRNTTKTANRHPKVRFMSNQVVSNSRQIYYISGQAVANVAAGDVLNNMKLVSTTGWYSGNRCETWDINFTNGDTLSFENEPRGYNNYPFSRLVFKPHSGNATEIYNERQGWLMDEFVLPNRLTVQSITWNESGKSLGYNNTTELNKTKARGIRQSNILDRVNLVVNRIGD